jgi:hypothetical protein
VIFKTVNVDNAAARARVASEGLKHDAYNSTVRLNRYEFLEAMVLIAMLRYVETGKIPDVSDAIDQCCTEMRDNLVRHLTPNSHQ